MDEGDYAHLSCIVTKGDMPVTIRWTLHGKQNLVPGSDAAVGVETTQSGPRASFLSIPSVGQRHRGVYTCAAVNEAGSASHSVELFVNGEDKHTAVQVDFAGNKQKVLPKTETCPVYAKQY